MKRGLVDWVNETGDLYSTQLVYDRNVPFVQLANAHWAGTGLGTGFAYTWSFLFFVLETAHLREQEERLGRARWKGNYLDTRRSKMHILTTYTFSLSHSLTHSLPKIVSSCSLLNLASLDAGAHNRTPSSLGTPCARGVFQQVISDTVVNQQTPPTHHMSESATHPACEPFSQSDSQI